jgi:hypothetical protein
LAALTSPHSLRSATSDGRGNLVLSNSSGSQFDASPHALRPVGALLVAVGPADWLGLSCQYGSCRNVVVNGATNAHRVLPGPGLDVVDWPWPADPGAVAPNGSLAAVTVASTRREVALDLISLRTGVARTLPVAVDLASSSRTLAWSPDSRWLFVITATGGVVAVSAHDGSVHSLGITLPQLSQIAMRSPRS